MFGAIITAYRWFFLQLAESIGFGWGIVMLSVICSALMIPLMHLVAGAVRREADYQSVILPQVADIRKRYEDELERHRHLQRLYRRYGYSPLSAIKKAFPLFVQVPFLLLTYFMLKDTAELRGVPFLFLRDLGRPDALLSTIGVNLLPFAMTAVNLVTVFATPGFAPHDQAQAVGISLLFFVLLFSAPSALLLYWTLNNLITLARTLVAHRGEGARLLGSRVVGLKRLPAALRSGLTDRRKAVLGMSFFLVALYMRLVVQMEAGFINCMASSWLMNIALAVSMGFGYALHRHGDHRVTRFLYAVSMVIASCVAVLNTLVLLSAPVSFSAMAWVAKRVDLADVFDGLLAFAMVPVIVGLLRKEVWRAMGNALRQGGVWLLGVLVLAVHYSFASRNFKLPLHSVALLAFYMVAPCVLLVAMMVGLYHRFLPPAWISRMVLGSCIGVFLIPMVSLESGRLLSWHSNLLVRLLVMGGAALCALRITGRKTIGVFLSLSFLFVVGHAGAATFQASRAMEEKIAVPSGGDVRQALIQTPCLRTNSIFLLVYDGYASDIVLHAVEIKAPGIARKLQGKGFVSYEAYSIGDNTLPSMGAVFNLGGVVQGSDRSSMAGNNVFCDWLRQFGYRSSYVLCGYDMPMRGERMPGDSYFPTVQKVTRPERVLYPCLLRGFLSQSPNTFHSYTREEWLAVKRRLMRDMPAFGGFLYAHSACPGHLAANPAYRKPPEEERRDYERALSEADRELQEDIDLLLSRDDESVIIVASDHGPYLTLPDKVGEYDALSLLDRLGVQLHVRWPRDYKPCLKLDCLQNLFLEVMIYLSGDETLSRFASDGASLRVQYPLRAPAGSVVRGVVQSGPDQGKGLFEAAREEGGRL